MKLLFHKVQHIDLITKDITTVRYTITLADNEYGHDQFNFASRLDLGTAYELVRALRKHDLIDGFLNDINVKEPK